MDVFKPEKMKKIKIVSEALIFYGANERMVYLISTHLGFRKSDAVDRISRLLSFFLVKEKKLYREGIVRAINRTKVNTMDHIFMDGFRNKNFEDAFPLVQKWLEKFEREQEGFSFDCCDGLMCGTM